MASHPFGDDLREVRRDVSWDAFEQFLDAKGEASTPRVTYLDGVLELVTPSRGHERQAGWLARLVEVYAIERGIDLSAYGSWTLKDKLRRAGCEPDECYVVGDDSDAPLERPHLAIESQWSRSAINKLEVYRRLDVGEVWLVRDRAIAIHVLDGAGSRQATRSACFPGLDLVELGSFLDRPTMTAAMRAFQAALRQK